MSEPEEWRESDAYKRSIFGRAEEARQAWGSFAEAMAQGLTHAVHWLERMARKTRGGADD